MKILGLDYGKKRVGVAISDEALMFAHARDFLLLEPFKKFSQALLKIIEEEKVETLIVGIPKNMDGSMGASAQHVEEFILRLQKIVSIPIKKIDERLSTVEASRRLHESGLNTRKQKKHIDSQSAVVFLQVYLDSLSSGF